MLTYPGCPNLCIDAVFRERLNVCVCGRIRMQRVVLVRCAVVIIAIADAAVVEDTMCMLCHY